jgi:uncharacterized protein (TIGR03435 family)
MNHEDAKLAKWLKKALPPPEETELASRGVFGRLLSIEAEDSQATSPETYADKSEGKHWSVALSIGTAAAIAAFLFVILFYRNGAQPNVQALARIENSENQIGNGESVRSGASEGTTLALIDGSRVEMRIQSELRLERVTDGVRIDLKRGSIIVSAAKQPSGHLYVQTKDVTVSVVGTVFYVSAEEVGSRVGVIEGVVNVQQRGSSKSLVPGQQVASAPIMPEVSLFSEISWSHNVPLHIALLEQIPAAIAPPVPPAHAGRPNFEVASIKPNNSGDLRTTSARPLPANGTYTATNQSVRQLIRQAYGLKQFQLEGGPKWIDDFSDEKFDVSAKAAGPVTSDELMLMLQGLLEDRFKLTYHRETRQLPTYALVIAKKGVLGPNLREPDPDIRQLYPVLGSPSGMTAVNATMQDLASSLSRVSGGRLVQDRTGLTSRFAFTLTFVPDPGTLPRPPGLPLPPLPADGPSLFQALQEQLGLKLESEKGPVEIMIVDRVQRPSEN